MTPLTKTTADICAFPVLPDGDQQESAQILTGPWNESPKSGLDVLLSVHEEFEPLKAVWQKLERTGDCTPFQTYAWLSAWQRHIGTKQDVRPAIVVGWDSRGDALFILPLAIQGNWLCPRLVWLGGDLGDYQAPLLSKEFSHRVGSAGFPALWAQARKLLPTHHIVSLDRMPERVGAQANPFMALDGNRFHPCFAHKTVLKSDWESYYGEKRSSASRKRDKQKRRKTEELGPVSLVMPTTVEERLETLDALIAQKSVAFARMGVANLFDKPGYRDFYRDLATSADAGDMIHICYLDVGGAVAAANWGVSFGGRYSYVLASYDETAETAKYGPGVIQLMELMAHATATDHSEFDFTIGDEAYKEQWCEVEVPLYDHMEPNSLMGWIGLGPEIAYSVVKRFIKQSPVLWRWFTRLRATAGSLRTTGA
ncbi:MAG: GNAT family N-acetyltransferase [Parvibaculum sp.]|uniref:GNAT family N-acetyltransferase n=1 Tax=Parvibaculum sp. TaxID=2024848 RepID=UPI00349FF45E